MNNYTPYDLTELLHLSKASVYKLIESGKLPVIRIGRKILISEQDLRAFLESRKEGGITSVSRPQV